jgi:hypothetical protein
MIEQIGRYSKHGIGFDGTRLIEMNDLHGEGREFQRDPLSDINGFRALRTMTANDNHEAALARTCNGSCLRIPL